MSFLKTSLSEIESHGFAVQSNSFQNNAGNQIFSTLANLRNCSAGKVSKDDFFKYISQVFNFTNLAKQKYLWNRLYSFHLHHYIHIESLFSVLKLMFICSPYYSRYQYIYCCAYNYPQFYIHSHIILISFHINFHSYCPPFSQFILIISIYIIFIFIHIHFVIMIFDILHEP